MLRAACALSSCDPTLDLSLLSRSPRLDDEESPLPPLVGVADPVPDLSVDISILISYSFSCLRKGL